MFSVNPSVHAIEYNLLIYTITWSGGKLVSSTRGISWNRARCPQCLSSCQNCVYSRAYRHIITKCFVIKNILARKEVHPRCTNDYIIVSPILIFIAISNYPKYPYLIPYIHAYFFVNNVRIIPTIWMWHYSVFCNLQGWWWAKIRNPSHIKINGNNDWDNPFCIHSFCIYAHKRLLLIYWYVSQRASCAMNLNFLVSVCLFCYLLA